MVNVHSYLADSGILVFKLTGELKIATAEESKDQIKAAIEDKHPETVILELSELTFLDSAGLAAFISAFKLLATIGGKLYVCNLKNQPKVIFEISNMQKIIPAFPTLEDALQHFGKKE
jgi:stage II sporulation protein AA (anti-sigma F factor antagonist)